MAWLVLAIMLAFTCILALTSSWQDGWAVAAQLFGYFLGVNIPLWMMLFGLYFPFRLVFDRRYPWIKWLIIVPLIFFAMLGGAGCGYEVVSARNGVEALQLLEQDKIDLIISDILMPQMDGFELCRQVKQRADLRHIPFIFYTATYTEKKDQELGLRLGASRFILKPVEPDDLTCVLP